MPKIDFFGAAKRIKLIEDGLRERYGGALTVADIMKEFSLSRVTAMKWLDDVPSVFICGRRKYKAEDVAVKIWSVTDDDEL